MCFDNRKWSEKKRRKSATIRPVRFFGVSKLIFFCFVHATATAFLHSMAESSDPLGSAFLHPSSPYASFLSSLFMLFFFGVDVFVARGAIWPSLTMSSCCNVQLTVIDTNKILLFITKQVPINMKLQNLIKKISQTTHFKSLTFWLIFVFWLNVAKLIK